MTVVSTLAVPLRSFPYGETSRVIRFYTEERGVLGVMARGIRRGGSKKGGSPPPGTFSRGMLSVHFKESRELQTLREFSPDKPRRALGEDVVRLAAASIIGEILLRHAEEEGNPSTFLSLDQALDALERAEGPALVSTLLGRAWMLVDHLGYRPAISHCTGCGAALDEGEIGRFDFASGGIRCNRCTEEIGGPRLGPGARRQLEELLTGAAPEDLRGTNAHLRLLEGFATYHLSEGRPFRSFRVLQDLMETGGV